MRKKTILSRAIILLCLWLIPFLLSASIVLYWKAWLPKDFSSLFSEVTHTFSPQIAIIIAFIFSDRFFGKNQQLQKPHFLLAVILSSLYICFFLIIIIMFHTDRLKAYEAISSFQLLRATLNFLISGTLVFLFSSREEIPKNSSTSASDGL